jgi:hypothetical protein
MADNTREEGKHANQPHRAAAPPAYDPALAAPPPTAEQRREAEEKVKQANEKAAQKAREKAAEFSDKMFEAQQKALSDAQEEAKKTRETVQKHQEERRKEVERRAALSPEERLEEDEKIAAMTPEEIAKRDEERGQVGFVSPEQMDQINLLAGTPQYPLFSEGSHPAEMILTEANGQRSRAYAYLADPITIKVGQPLKQTVAPTSTTPGTFVPAAAGADCSAIAIYGGTSNPANGLRIAVLVRDCEINGYCINWGAITVPEQAIGLTTLAAAGIIVRY